MSDDQQAESVLLSCSNCQAEQRLGEAFYTVGGTTRCYACQHRADCLNPYCHWCGDDEDAGPACSDCVGATTILDPLSGNEEPYACPSCGSSGRAADQITGVQR